MTTQQTCAHDFVRAVQDAVAGQRPGLLVDEVGSADRPRPFTAPTAPGHLDLRAEKIGTVVLATGFRPDHSWLRLPVLDPDGMIRQYRGIPTSGVYVVGQRFHRRGFGFIDGARHDAHALLAHLLTGSVPQSRQASCRRLG